MPCLRPKAPTPFDWPMTKVEASAPAKVNLTLHVTGQRTDGYHKLDSLVVFADVADHLTATLAPDLRITVSGPFSVGVPTDHTNLVLRAASALRDVRGVTQGAAITLDKHLPHAAGIGSGSADAAAALSLLSGLWNVAPLPANAPEVLALGADVPVCMRTPAPTRMTGIGETLMSTPALPDCAMVLINPRVEVPTGQVFAGLTTKTNPAMGDIPTGLDFTGFINWMKQTRNDLLPPARLLAPEVDAAINRLNAMPAVQYAGMSGSGATCFGLVRNMADARQVARAIQVGEMSWWVAPAQVL